MTGTGTNTITKTVLLTLTLGLATTFAFAQEVPPDYQAVMKTVGKSGDYKGNVLKVNIPRNDLHVKVAGYSLPTPFGFGGWFAMTKAAGGEDVVMGDLVLTQDQVNPVMSALLDNGLEVTALHNHFLWEEPRVFYMHVHGHGSPADLARRVKPAIDLIGKSSRGAAPASPASAPANPLNVERLAQIAGHEGEQTGAVYKITVGRDDLKISEMGAPINSRMGLNTWAAFVGTNENAAIAGDIAMQ